MSPNIIEIAQEAVATLRNVVDDLEAPDHYVAAVEDLEETLSEFFEDLLLNVVGG